MLKGSDVIILSRDEAKIICDELRYGWNKEKLKRLIEFGRLSAIQSLYEFVKEDIPDD